MFKRRLTLIACAFYFILSIGLVIDIHFCGGKLDNLSFNLPFSKDSCCGDEKKSMGCCNNEELVIKIEDNQNTRNILQVAPLSLSVAIIFLTNHPEIEDNSDFTTCLAIDHPPPGNGAISLHLRNSVFLI